MKQVYQACDGAIFSNVEDCVEYEHKLLLSKLKKESFDFTGGDEDDYGNLYFDSESIPKFIINNKDKLRKILNEIE